MLMQGSGSVNNNYGSGFRSGSVQIITNPTTDPGGPKGYGSGTQLEAVLDNI